MTRETRLRLVALASVAAVLRLALPAPALALSADGSALAVPICGEAGHVLLIRLAGRAPARKPVGDGSRRVAQFAIAQCASVPVAIAAVARRTTTMSLEAGPVAHPEHRSRNPAEPHHRVRFG
jgi:hypothetical protein